MSSESTPTGQAPQASRIEVEWNDGRLERAEGDDAAEIWKAIEGGFVMNHIHGIDYSGPKMKVIKEPR